MKAVGDKFQMLVTDYMVLIDRFLFVTGFFSGGPKVLGQNASPTFENCPQHHCGRWFFNTHARISPLHISRIDNFGPWSMIFKVQFSSYFLPNYYITFSSFWSSGYGFDSVGQLSFDWLWSFPRWSHDESNLIRPKTIWQFQIISQRNILNPKMPRTNR